ncbi:hypothetical protein ScalyP_jg7718 [Parmales sp. scaly parma]|nr:hypothetical protein ScalyP_jg7718 [Parmales sp. scaly parma]
MLFLIADQFRHDSYSSSPTRNPKTSPSTPNLDSLALDGVRLSNLFSSTPTCTPSRSAILSGRSPWFHGMLGYDTNTDCLQYPTTLAGALSSLANFTTYSVGKDHFGVDPVTLVPISQGYEKLRLYDGLSEEFDDYDEFFANVMGQGVDPLQSGNLTWNAWQGAPYEFEEFLHPTSWTASEAVSLISSYFGSDDVNANDDVNPLFLKLSFHRPHSPYDPPKRLYDKYNDPTFPFPVPSRIICDNANNASNWDQMYYANYTADPSSSAPPEMATGDPGEAASRASRAAYYGSIEFVDENIGRVIEELKERNLYDEMLVVFVSDHGDMNGDHYMWRKGYPFNQAAKVPGIIKWPASWENGNGNGSTKNDKNKIKVAKGSGSVLDQVVELRDVAPTFWDAAGILDQLVEADPLINGKSMLPLLAGDKNVNLREFIDLEHNQGGAGPMHFNALTDGKSKYVFYPDDGRELLFDLVADPDESNDISKNENDAETQALRGMWRQRMIDMFVSENRGERWVTEEGDLALRGSIEHSPHFPCAAS